MTRLSSLMTASALLAAGLACRDTYPRMMAEQPEQRAEPDASAVTPMTTSVAPSSVPVEPQLPDADLGLRPPPVISTGGLPEPDPACPDTAPEADTRCVVAEGSALSCAWQQGSAIARCACVWKQDDPGPEVFWNCDPGPSGEGPPTSTCPDAAPVSGSRCSDRGSACSYAVPRFMECRCEVNTLTWKCGLDVGAHGGP
jgi:hypothetical protein